MLPGNREKFLYSTISSPSNYGLRKNLKRAVAGASMTSLLALGETALPKAGSKVCMLYRLMERV
jgi:hypothetical protein